MQNLQPDHSHHHPSRAVLSLRLLARDIETPANVGSLFCLVDAWRVEENRLPGGSLLPPSCELQKISRSTEAGARSSHTHDPGEVVHKLMAAGYRIISLEITRSSIDIRELAAAAPRKICLLLGSERTSVNQALLGLSDEVTHIPLLRGNSSMNVALACAIATFEIIDRFR